MSDDLFRAVSRDRATGRSRRVLMLPISAAVHALVAAALIVIPLAAIDAPSLGLREITFIQPVAPPSPPPAPVPRATVSTARQALRTSSKAPPVIAPSSIGSESGLQEGPAPPAAAGSDNTGTVPGGIDGGLPVPSARSIEPPPPVAPLPVGGRIQRPQKIRDVQPIYPDLAQRARIEGIVIIEAIIGQTGQVQEARVLRGVPLLEDAALEAVRQWVYAPTLLNGQPIAVVMTVTVNFKLK
jgi:periplasmic protein TonB